MCEIAEGDDCVVIVCEMIHTAFKEVGFGMYPGVIEVGYAVEGEDGGAAILCLVE